MNRETKRMMQRQGQVEADGSAASRRPDPADRAVRTRSQAADRPSLPARAADFGREVRSELRQVAWPTRPEVISSSIVVLVVLVLLVGLIFLLDYTFSHAVNYLFKT